MTDRQPGWNARDALAKANRINEQRAELLRPVVFAGTAWESRDRMADLVERAPEALATALIGRLLERCRQMKDVKAGLILDAAKLSKDSRLGDLTPRERDRLATALRQRTAYERRREQALAQHGEQAA